MSLKVEVHLQLFLKIGRQAVPDTRSCQSLEAKPSGTSGNPCNETTGPTMSETELCLVKPARGNSEEEVDEDFCWMNHSESFIYMSVPPYGRSPDIKVPHTLS